MFNIEKKINLLDMNRQGLQRFIMDLGEENFRVDQIMKWIYHDYCNDFDKMTNITKSLRNKLKIIAEIRSPNVVKEYRSSDGTIKWMIQVGNQQIETVFIPEKSHSTLCISSQVGCSLKCNFCATGNQGFNRNLRVFEILGQIWNVCKMIRNKELICRYPISNIVVMGMGEPLLNISNIVPAIEVMLDNAGFGLSKRHVTVSTSGIVPAINKFIDLVDVALAISLHASNDIIRNELMPINRKYNIKSVLFAVRRYLSKSKASCGKVTVEYVMLHHINDRAEHAHELASLLINIPCKINLIPWSFVPNIFYSCSSDFQIRRFAKILISYGFITTIRKTRGHDINAACGQLAGKITDKINFLNFL